MMHRDDFNYVLPDELIAQHPLSNRDESRMMVLRRSSKQRTDTHFKKILDYLQAGDLLVLNDTKVLACKLLGRRETGAAIEVLLLSEIRPGIFTALVRKAGRIKPKETLSFENEKLTATALERVADKWLLEFTEPHLLHTRLEKYGRMPLPPYISRNQKDPANHVDRSRYQTIYAHFPGAVAAPTAGLHFTQDILDSIQQKGVQVSFITLHVGEGTFKPVDTTDLSKHTMHSERYVVTSTTIQQITQAKQRGGRVIAVGTTTARTLETLALQGSLAANEGETSLFIHPPYSFKAIDGLLTNFHLPRSTLLMLVCAFAGYEWTIENYQEAVRQRYRFYSYGDCMLIL